jgi:ribosomal protein S18 acetylase RimI-like enzyme
MAGHQSRKHVNRSIRAAQPTDLEVVLAIDPHANHPERRAFLERNLSAGTCWIMLEDQSVRGFVVLEPGRFFGLDFVSLLCVGESSRRSGVGTALMGHCETICHTPRLFSSTNLSNAPMHAMFSKLGFRVSGMVDDLDPGDPEVFYCKILRS